MSKFYLVHQTAYFAFKVQANSPEEADMKSRQLDYNDAWESYADSPSQIIECDEDGLTLSQNNV